MISLLCDGLRRSGIELDLVCCQKQVQFLQELLRWNRQVNLTAIVDPREAIEKHIIDSLLILPLIKDAKTLLDMGSGGGLPGIPLLISCPGLSVVSVDSVGKKISFQRHIKRLLKLEGLEPIKTRLENLSDNFSQERCFDLITARAFASLELIAEKSAPWLAPDGRVLVMKGPEGRDEAIATEKLLTSVGLSVESIEEYRLPFSSAQRQVIVLKKQ